MFHSQTPQKRLLLLLSHPPDDDRTILEQEHVRDPFLLLEIIVVSTVRVVMLRSIRFRPSPAPRSLAEPSLPSRAITPLGAFVPVKIQQIALGDGRVRHGGFESRGPEPRGSSRGREVGRVEAFSLEHARVGAVRRRSGRQVREE